MTSQMALFFHQNDLLKTTSCYVREIRNSSFSETSEVRETLSALWSITEVLETHIVILSYVIRNHVDIMKYTVFQI